MSALTIQEVLAETEEVLNDFLSILTKEKDALRKNDLETVQSIIDDKQIIFAKLQNLDTQREAILLEAKCSNNKLGLMNYLEQLPTIEAKFLREKWQMILSLLSQCEILNQHNGLVIVGAKAHTEHLVDLLLGRESHSTYTKEGKDVKAYSSRSR